jgi:hypothetical protein
MVDELRAPLLQAKGKDPQSSHRAARAPGALALHALAPNFSRLPWPDVIALHDDDAIATFRARLTDFEAEVVNRPEEEWDEAIKDLALDDAIQKANARLPRASRALADVAIDVAAGFLPPGVSHAATFAKTAAELQLGREERRNEWLAVLLRLRQLR